MSNIAQGGDMDAAFNKREAYKNKTQLGNPADTSKFINKDANSSHLQNLNDSSLINKGGTELRNSQAGKLLQNTEEKKIDAIQKYKINEKNTWLKDSLAIEENPMPKTGGRDLKSTETSIAEQLRKTCTEGVDFNVDVGLELVVEAEEEEYLGPIEQKIIYLPFYTLPSYWWILGYRENDECSGPTHTISTIYNDGIAAFIATIFGNDTSYLITVPNQDIVVSSLPCFTKNVDFTNCPNYWGIYVSAYANIKFHYNSQPKLKRFIEKGEYWQVATEGMEQLVQNNECYETARICQKSGTNTFFGKYPVTRPCWYEKISYRCQSEPKDGCNHLINQGCRLHSSNCEYQVGSICLKWKRDYNCAGSNKKQVQYSHADSPIYCLGGDCHSPTFEDNKDFTNVSYLAALNEAKNDCTKEPSGLCKNPITVFGGQVEACKKIITGFINCCASMKGWGRDVNLCRCSGEERGLALKRERGLCHSVGTYCSKRAPIFRTCLEKKTNFCCFSSKLSRIFQEQGRKQLGINWGTAENPNCRALTLDELTRLDFSKFDMEELFEALLTKGKNNQNKQVTTPKAKEIPAIQKEPRLNNKGL